MATINFNANNVEPQKAFEPLPDGKYTATITESEMKPTKRGSGSYLQLTLKVIEGPHANRILFDRLNLNNPNPVAVDIAKGTLSAICHATGVMTPNDSVQLHNIPMTITVKVRKSDDGQMSNDIKGYAKRTQAAPAATTVQGSDGKSPWER